MGVPIIASPSGGMSKFKARNLGAAQQIAATPANFYGCQVNNTGQFPAWIQFFDKAAPVIGVDAPDKEFYVPGNTSLPFKFMPQGSQFTTALFVAATTTEAGGQECLKGVHVFVDYCPA